MQQVSAPTVITKLEPQKSQQFSSAQPTSFIVVYDHQPKPSRQLIFALSPVKILNTPSISSTQSEESQPNISVLSCLEYSIRTTVPADPHTSTIFRNKTFTKTITSVNSHSARTSNNSVSPAKRVSPSLRITLHKSLLELYTLKKAFLRATQIFQKQLIVVLFFQSKNTPSNTSTTPPNTYQKLSE